MNKTKIEWCSMTWNPVTGCLHGCKYCYAEKQTQRFAGKYFAPHDKNIVIQNGGIHEDFVPLQYKTKQGKLIKASYPYGFDPTFHRYRLAEPQRIKTPQTVFVCSMADLFGQWVPDEWIQEVFKACEAAPQHNYLFLTKNPERYDEIAMTINMRKCRPNWYLGTSITGGNQQFYSSGVTNCFLSIEPLLQQINGIDLTNIDWVIIGAETGNRKGKIIPKREWIESIVNACKEKDIPVFMKNSLSGIWGDTLIQEMPF